jgi:hypothetical protein
MFIISKSNDPEGAKYSLQNNTTALLFITYNKLFMEFSTSELTV